MACLTGIGALVLSPWWTGLSGPEASLSWGTCLGGIYHMLMACPPSRGLTAMPVPLCSHH